MSSLEKQMGSYRYKYAVDELVMLNKDSLWFKKGEMVYVVGSTMYDGDLVYTVRDCHGEIRHVIEGDLSVPMLANSPNIIVEAPILPLSERKVNMHWSICEELNVLYEQKNSDYGDSFGKARIDVPNYTLGKLYDKFERFKNLTLNGNQQVEDETIEDTLMDLANYCIMELVERNINK